MATHKDLNVYKRSYKLALEIHRISLELPKYLQFDLADQIRRASRSIPSNIAEGYSRSRSKADIQHFLRIALGSNDEMLFNLEFLKDTKLMDSDTYDHLANKYIIVGKQLVQLMRSIGNQ